MILVGCGGQTPDRPPCPCGYLGDSRHACRCSHHQIQRYRAKISGPLLDRIDIHVEVPAVPYRDLERQAPAEPSAAIRARVLAARKRQAERLGRSHCNAQMTSRHVRTHCRIDDAAGRLLESAIDRLGLSARSHNRVLKIARTIADLSGEPDITADHVGEAIQYRTLDRRQSGLTGRL